MEETNSISNLSIYYIIVMVLILSAVFNIFLYMRKKKIKNRRLKSVMNKLKVDVNQSAVPNSRASIIKLTILGLFVLSAVSVGLCFYIERLLAMDNDIIIYFCIVFVCMIVTVLIIRLKINKNTFNQINLPPVMFNAKINIIFSIPMFLTSIYTVIMALAIPAVFVVSINKILYLVIIVLMYVLWLIILTAPKKVSISSEEKYYRSSTASDIVKYYDSFAKQSLREDKVTKALVSINKVFAYLLYSEYSKAETEIDKFNWNEQCESLRFNKKSLLAVKNYMTGKHLDGYKFAYEARDELQDAITKYSSRHYLTDGQSEKLRGELFKSQDIITDIGQVLSGSLDRILINKLSDRFEEMKTKNLQVSIIIAWCLYKAHSDLGEKRERAAFCQFIKEKAPNCKSLHL